jgi:serine phosphatase RsbU (regulator of sigma subunit)
MRAKKSRKGFGTRTWHYTLVGFLFGLCFPLIGYTLSIQEAGLAFNYRNVLQVQDQHKVLFVADLAPLVLAICFTILGRYMQYQLNYLVDMASFERDLRDVNYTSKHKLSLLTIRKTYMWVFSITSLLIIIGLVLVMSHQESVRKRDERLITLLVNSPQTISSDVSYAEVQHESSTDYSTLNDKTKVEQNSNQGYEDAGNLLLFKATSLIAQNTVRAKAITFICGIILLIVVSIFVYVHFYVFAPNFMLVQKAIYENTIARHTISRQSEELKIAHEERDENFKQIEMNLEQAVKINTAIDEYRGLSTDCAENWFLVSHPLQILSGDFVWNLKLDNNRQIWFLGDSIGHGVAGHLQSNLYKVILQDITRTVHDPLQILQMLHNEVVKIGKGMLDFTCEAAIVLMDSEKGEVSYVGAGISLIHHCKESRIYRAQKFTIGSTRLQVSLEKQEIKVAATDWLLLSSDGMKNMFNKENQRLTEAGSVKLIEASISDSSVSFHMSLDKAIGDYKKFAVQNDDVTVLAIRNN